MIPRIEDLDTVITMCTFMLLFFLAVVGMHTIDAYFGVRHCPIESVNPD